MRRLLNKCLYAYYVFTTVMLAFEASMNNIIIIIIFTSAYKTEHGTSTYFVILYIMYMYALDVTV